MWSPPQSPLLASSEDREERLSAADQKLGDDGPDSLSTANDDAASTQSQKLPFSLGDTTAPNEIPFWGKLIAPGAMTPSITLYADKYEYTIGRAPSADIQIPYTFPYSIRSRIGRIHCTIKWSGYGIAGWGKEKGQHVGPKKEDCIGISITSSGANPFPVGGRNIKETQTLDLQWGVGFCLAPADLLRSADLSTEELYWVLGGRPPKDDVPRSLMYELFDAKYPHSSQHSSQPSMAGLTLLSSRDLS